MRSARGREQFAYLVGVRARPGGVADRGCALSACAAWPGLPRRVPVGVGCAGRLGGSRALRCPWALAARVCGRGPLLRLCERSARVVRPASGARACRTSKAGAAPGCPVLVVELEPRAPKRMVRF